jgi:hypothetical protein
MSHEHSCEISSPDQYLITKIAEAWEDYPTVTRRDVAVHLRSKENAQDFKGKYFVLAYLILHIAHLFGAQVGGEFERGQDFWPSAKSRAGLNPVGN